MLKCAIELAHESPSGKLCAIANHATLSNAVYPDSFKSRVDLLRLHKIRTGTAPNMTGYQPTQTLYPMNLLAQLTQRQFSGCLQVSSGAAAWLIYLEKGKLLYTSNSVEPFERLERHLTHLSHQVPTLASAVRIQVQALFGTSLPHQSTQICDYQAICWLVHQRYLSPAQAAILVEGLAKEVLESLLLVREGTYEIIDPGIFTQFPKFCQLDIPRLVSHFPMTQVQSPKVSGSTSNVLFQSNSSSVPTGTASKPNSVTTVKSQLERSTSGENFSIKKVYKIACIDDNPSVLQAINQFLDSENFSVIMISDSLKALMQIMRCKPDLILLDVTMPNLDGYELCSLLRRHSSFNSTPIIMVTGNTGLIDRAKARLVRASDYLTKPFSKSDLLKIVHNHLP